MRVRISILLARDTLGRMATLNRIRVEWSGLTALPGVSTFYAPESDSTAVAGLVTFFNAIKFGFPNGLSWNIYGTGDTIDEATGHINGIWTSAGSGTVTSTGGATNYAAGVGMRVRWLSGGIVHNRRVNGSTYLTSLTTLGYGPDGTLDTSMMNQFQTAANALVSATSLRVYSPPWKGSPTNPARAGSSYEVIASVIPDRVTALRSRRY